MAEDNTQLETLNLIQKATIRRLEEKGLDVGKLAVRGQKSKTLASLSATASIADGEFKRLTNTAYKAQVNIYLVIKVTKRSDEEERREVMNRILLSALQILDMQDLGLKIDPIAPVKFREFTSEEEAQNGQMLYVVQFKTGFTLRKMTDDEIETDLLKVGLTEQSAPGGEVSTGAEITIS